MFTNNSIKKPGLKNQTKKTAPYRSGSLPAGAE